MLSDSMAVKAIEQAVLPTLGHQLREHALTDFLMVTKVMPPGDNMGQGHGRRFRIISCHLGMTRCSPGSAQADLGLNS